MMDNLAPARARESADRWLADRDQKQPRRGAMRLPWVGDLLRDAFVAGWGQATAPETEAEVNEIVVSLVRDAIEAAGDSAPEEAAAIDAAQRIVAYLGAIHREEQDQWAEERQIGQRQLDDATALMRETAELLRGYEKHHRDEAFRLGCGTDEHRDRTAKAERNALAAARLEAWLRGEERYPTNPAEVLRGMAEGLAAQAGLGVDHPSFDAAAAHMEARLSPVADTDVVLNHEGEVIPIRPMGQRPPGLADMTFAEAPPGTPIPIYRLGEAVDLVSAMEGAALIERGDGWVKVHGVRNAHDLFNVLRLAKIAAECGEPDEENPEAPAEWFGAARWRTDGVADLAALRLNTADPRFDPAGPVTINGFLFHPAKEN